MNHNKLTKVIASFILTTLILGISPTPSLAQVPSCQDYPVSPALIDLGANEYLRMNTNAPYSLPLQYFYTPSGVYGGLYPNGSNEPSPNHFNNLIDVIDEITPSNSLGEPDPVSGKIGMSSLGMSNTQSEFQSFLGTHVNPVTRTTVNDKLKIVNGALSGGVVEYWTDPNNTNYNTYWSNLNTAISNAGLTPAQMQVFWVKVTQAEYHNNFPQSMENLTDLYTDLMHEIHTRFPNVKIVFMSSRTRSFGYFGTSLSSEPMAFENGFAVRWLIERQLNQDPELNPDPDQGPVTSPHIAWGPYLWADGSNPRSDGLTWALTDTTTDCTHPSATGKQKVAQMLWNYFSTSPLTTPWFLDANTPIPTPTPTLSITPSPSATPSATPTPTMTPTPTPTNTPTPTPTAGPTLTPTPTLEPTSTPTPSPTAVPGAPTSIWSFTSTLEDDLNGCSTCLNTGADWTSLGVANGAFALDSTDKLDLGDFPYLYSQPQISINLWLKPNFDETNTTTWYNAFTDGSNVILQYIPPLRDWRANLRTTTASYFTDTQNTSWDPDTWHMITLTYDGASLKLYWDGTLHTTKAATGNIYSDSGKTYLGYNGMTGTNGIYFNGSVDELRTYNVALSPAQIQSLFQNP